jgi:hypothetical protein
MTQQQLQEIHKQNSLNIECCVCKHDAACHFNMDNYHWEKQYNQVFIYCSTINTTNNDGNVIQTHIENKNKPDTPLQSQEDGTFDNDSNNQSWSQ